jgi:hypothetical protein
LAGVSQSALDIEQGLRTVAEVKKVIADLGLKIASGKAYESWMVQRKEKTAQKERFDTRSSSQTFSLASNA